MIRRLAVAGFLVVGLFALSPAVAASAHPLGNFTINTSSQLVSEPGRITVNYVLDEAEIPTQQAMPAIDADGNGDASAAEKAAWAKSQAAELVNNVSLEANGGAVPLAVVKSGMQFRPGQAGLPIIRLEAVFTSALDSVPNGAAVAYRDDNDAGHIGWREITAVGVTGSSVPEESVSAGLCSYPQDLLTSPLSVTSATFTAGGSAAASGGAGGCGSGGSGTAAAARPGVTGGAFADLVNNRGFVLMSLAVLLAMAFGGIHAMAPGHGKSITAAYLVGAGGRMRQAVMAGVAIAGMHTASVLGLGLLILSAQKLFAPERVYPWLGLVSGIVVLGLGTFLLTTRARAIGRSEGLSAAKHEEGEDLAHDHADGHDHGHSHPELDPSQSLLSKKGLTALAISGGMLPSPTALVVLLAAVAIHRVAFGLALILAFSIGLAAALIGIGVAAIRARDVVSNRLGSRVGRLVPVASACAIMVVGGFLVVRAAGQL